MNTVFLETWHDCKIYVARVIVSSFFNHLVPIELSIGVQEYEFYCLLVINTVSLQKVNILTQYTRRYQHITILNIPSLLTR